MATDHATSVETDAQREAYISPTVDFVLLATMATAVALACAAVIIL